jgi:hypothetical protein
MQAAIVSACTIVCVRRALARSVRRIMAGGNETTGEVQNTARSTSLHPACTHGMPWQTACAPATCQPANCSRAQGVDLPLRLRAQELPPCQWRASQTAYDMTLTMNQGTLTKVRAVSVTALINSARLHTHVIAAPCCWPCAGIRYAIGVCCAHQATGPAAHSCVHEHTAPTMT